MPGRRAKPFKPGDGVKHGFYAQSQPCEEVLAIIDENIQGMGEEIAGLRRLGRGLLERQGLARNREEAALLGEAYTLTATRLAVMIETEGQLRGDGEEDARAEQLLAVLDRIAIEKGREPESPAIRAAAMGEEPELATAARRLTEEIASTRYVLRNTLEQAMEARRDDRREAGDTRETIKLTEIYSMGCSRLARLLRSQVPHKNRLSAYVDGMVDQTITGLNREWGWIE